MSFLGRLSTWARRHPFAVDTLLTGLLIIVATVSNLGALGQLPGLLVASAVLLAPLAWRRRAPFAVFSTIAAVALVVRLYTPTTVPGYAALLVALYTVAACCPPRRAKIAGAVTAVLIVLIVLGLSPYQRSLAELVALCGLASAAAMIGAYGQSRRAYLAAVEDRAARMERERDQRAQLAVAQERARIAREMHDVVTHSLSVMVTLADGAALAVRRAPDRAEAAMEQAAGTGRQALTDMRRFLDVLREDEPDALRHPQPGIAQLEDLAAQVHAAGLPVRLRVEGEAAAVPAAGQLTVYRLVQEALTNTLNHAAPGARAVVLVHCAGDHVDLEVRDDGSALPAPVTREPGHGIQGMRNRAAAYGGTLAAGPLSGGGWRVATRLNLCEPGPARQFSLEHAEGAGGEA